MLKPFTPALAMQALLTNRHFDGIILNIHEAYSTVEFFLPITF